MVAQEQRFLELVEASRGVAAQVAERAHDMQRLSQAVSRASNEKDALMTALADVQRRQDAALEQVQATEGQLARAEALLARIEERQAQAAVSETRVAAVESRCLDIVRLGEEMERRVQSITERGEQVQAVKTEVEGIYAVCERTKADLAYVADRRAEMAGLRTTTDALLAQTEAANQRLAALNTKMTLLDAVQDKAEAVAALLDDVRTAYDQLTERHAAVGQVADKVTRLVKNLDARKPRAASETEAVA